LGDPFPAFCRAQGIVALPTLKVLPLPEVSSVAFTDFVLALSGLLGTLLIPFAGLYWLLLQKRRAAARALPAAVRAQLPGRVK